MVDTKQDILNRIDNIRIEVELVALSHGTLDQIDALRELLDGFDFSEEDAAVTPGYSALTDTLWSMTDNDREFSQAEYDFLEQWAKTRTDSECYGIDGDIQEQASEWRSYDAKSAFMNRFNDMATPEEIEAFEALEDEGDYVEGDEAEDYEPDEDWLDEDDYNGRKIT